VFVLFCSNSMFAFTEIAVCKCSLRVMIYAFVPVVWPAHCVSSLLFKFFFAFTEILVCKCSLRVMIFVFVPVVCPAHCVTSVHCVFYFNFRLVQPLFYFVFFCFHIDGLIGNQLLKVIIPFTYTSQILFW
jgi:hypothetical protein